MNHDIILTFAPGEPVGFLECGCGWLFMCPLDIAECAVTAHRRSVLHRLEVVR